MLFVLVRLPLAPQSCLPDWTTAACLQLAACQVALLSRRPAMFANLQGRGRGAAAPPVRRAATLDVEAAKNLAQQMQAERAKAEQVGGTGRLWGRGNV